MNAFDADCLIYAANPTHSLGQRVLERVLTGSAVGSVLLLPELLTKPLRMQSLAEERRLLEIVDRFELLDVTAEIARTAVAIGAKYGLRASDSIHLATAVFAGADCFVTNNKRDFPQSITEVDVVYPADL